MWIKNIVLVSIVFSLVGINDYESDISKDALDAIVIQKEIIKDIEFQEKDTEKEKSNSMDEDNEDRQEIEKEIKLIKFNIDGLKLKAGVASEDVFKVSKFLKEKGYTDITESYYYNNKIKEVIIEYQKENNLIADGIIGRNTYQKINEDIEINKIRIPEIKLSFKEEVPGEYWIIVSKGNNTLYYLKGKEIINRYPIATGKNKEYTPEGKFTILIKYKNPSWGGAGRYEPVKGGAPNNPLGKRWMGLNIRGGGIYGIHGNSDRESIGKYVSLGCIRMYNKDVENLYDLIEIGTPVWIGNWIKLEEYGISLK